MSVPEASVIPPPRSAYGCLFCVTGKEEAVAERINQTCPNVRALTARQEKYKSIAGVKSRETEILLPSYVFFRTEGGQQAITGLPREHVRRLLTSEDGVWQLYGADERFVRWLFAYDGLLGFSKARRMGNRVELVSGPLKDMEAQIQRIDRRGRSGKVELCFQDRRVPVWLAFEWMDEMPECGGDTDQETVEGK